MSFFFTVLKDCHYMMIFFIKGRIVRLKKTFLVTIFFIILKDSH